MGNQVVVIRRESAAEERERHRDEIAAQAQTRSGLVEEALSGVVEASFGFGTDEALADLLGEKGEK